MKSRLQALSKASNDDMLHPAILQSMLSEIDNNEKLQNKIGEILPFLSDGDRNIRKQALTVLAFYNSQFHIPIVQETIAEMASIKLSDSACLDIACGIISANIQYIKDQSQIGNIFTTLIKTNLRGNFYTQRLSAYKLFDSIISLKHPQIDAVDETIKNGGETIIESFKNFCGYEEDPRCLTIVFAFYSKFASKIFEFCSFNDHQRNELFDIIGVFFPIPQNEELEQQLLKTLASNPVFTNDLASLVSIKLKNSLADTRSLVYTALPVLLVNDNTNNEQVDSVISSFITSLNDHFDSDSTSATETVVNGAIDAITNFVKINQKSHQLIEQIAINDWTQKITKSKSSTEIRAFSIVMWNLDRVLHFANEAMEPLAECLDKSIQINDESRIQSILASIVEYLKIQSTTEKVENTNECLNLFYKTSRNVLESENRNLQITGLVFIREYIYHFTMPADESLIPTILNYLSIKPFSTQCLIALIDQEQYNDLLKTQFIDQLIEAILNKSSFYGIASNTGVVEFASKFTNIPTFSGPLYEAMAKSGNYRDLIHNILPQKVLDDALSMNLLNILKDDADADNLILAIAVRSNDDIMRDQLNNNYRENSNANDEDKIFSRHKELIFSAAKPSAVPSDYLTSGQISTEKLNLLYSAKFTEYPDGFTPNRIALALRSVFTKDFTPDDISQLFDFENQFDSVLGNAFEKFELIESRFVYNSEYKTHLWEAYHENLIDKPDCYLKLCLLCPPVFFASDMMRAIPLFPLFIKCDVKGTLDLLIFTIMNISSINGELEEAVPTVNNVMVNETFVSQVPSILNSILAYLDPEETKDARIRLDVCRIINLLPMAVPIKTLALHKSLVMRKLKKVLDDPKREVRQIAAQANLMWMKFSDKSK